MNKNSYAFILDQISFKFTKQGTYFFQNVCLALERGKMYFVQGKNGAGKSTLFRIMQGDIHDHEYGVGTVRIDDRSYSVDSDRSYGKYVRLLQQDVDMMVAPTFSVQENLQCALLPAYPGLQGLPHSLGSDLLVACGINLQQPVSSLSGGQRQILAIVMALQKPTCVLLLDEPTAALDTENAQKVMEFLMYIAREHNVVVIIISHDIELIAKYAQNEGYIRIQEYDGIRHVTCSSDVKIMG